jgi:glycosyltransferase involved in cell wall biosynthesis
METDNKVNTISVAMCTYNGSKYLSEQLDSIFRQTRQPDEIVICDDCSKDDTKELAKTLLNNWGGKYSLIQNEKNLGFVKNFEKAIGLCHGDVIFLSDQDDVWDKHKIDIMIQTFEKHPESVMVFHDSELVDQDLNMMYSSFWKDTLKFNYTTFLKHNYKKLYLGNVVQGSACAIKKIVFTKSRPFFEKSYHDEWLALTALTLGEIYPIPKVLMKYRQGHNEIGGLPTSRLNKLLRTIQDLQVKYKNDLNKYQRRLDVLRAFVNQFQIKKSYKLDIVDYVKFLEKRIRSIKDKNKSQIFAVGSYKKYLDHYDFKNEYIKDCIEIFRK